MSNSREVRQYKEIPYTMIGHTTLNSEFSIFLRGDALKELIKLMREGEDLRITVSERNSPKFEIVDTHKKYVGETNEREKS